MSVEAQIVGVFPRRDSDSGTHIAKVNFAYKHKGMMPLKVVRTYKTDDGKFKDFDLGEVEGDCIVRVRGARLYQGDRGPFLSPDGFVVPYEVRDFVAGLAFDELASRQEAMKLKGAA